MQGVNLDGLYKVGDSETVGDDGNLLLGVFRASKHEQETPGSSRKS